MKHSDSAALSADPNSRIKGHIAGLGSLNEKTAQQAERYLIRAGRKAVEQLCEAAFNADPQVRFRAVWALGKSRDSRALPTILALIDDLDERVRYDAVLALGELRDTRAIAKLEEIARRPSEPAALDSAALRALAKLKSFYETP